ncbi:MAG: hypothetical protein IT371_27165 [Deltaproteobacteria bacterium]|nr:hypothetical protein [Deltaproteobacteria bacterium]
MTRTAPTALALALLLVGCKEGPFSGEPEVTTCGAADRPCGLSCGLACPLEAAEAVLGCVLTLEGELSADRRRCTFADGSVVSFATALSTDAATLRTQTLGVTIERGGKTCVSIKADPLDPAGGRTQGVTEIVLPGGTYRQEVWLAAAAQPALSDGGRDGRASSAPDSAPTELRPTRMAVECPSGKHYAGEGAELCSRCPALQCSALPALSLRALAQGTAVELRLVDGKGATPLFTCRAAKPTP